MKNLTLKEVFNKFNTGDDIVDFNEIMFHLDDDELSTLTEKADYSDFSIYKGAYNTLYFTGNEGDYEKSFEDNTPMKDVIDYAKRSLKEHIKLYEEEEKKYENTKNELYEKTYKLTLEKLKNYIAIGKDFILTKYKNIFIFNCEKINDYIGNCDDFDAIYTIDIIDDTFDTYDNDDELYNIVSSAIDDAIWENEGEIGYSVTYAEYDNTYYFEII